MFVVKGEKVNLKDISPDDTQGLDKDEIKKEYAALKERLTELQDVFYASRQCGLLIVLQGMDCSGKDGTVKRVLSGLNPNGFNVENFKVPTPVELGHDYLWRIHQKTPMRGSIAVFNRSYYEDVLVTRVHGLIDDDTAFRRFKEIREFEKYLVNNDTVVLKFMLHISKEFQEKKLRRRLESPEKQWKFSEADLKERKFWDEYQECYSDVLTHCSTHEAPWHVVPANHRWYRDYVILKTIVKTMEDMDLAYPDFAGNIRELIWEIQQSE